MYQQSLKEVAFLAELRTAVHGSELLSYLGWRARPSSRVRVEGESSLSSQSREAAWMNSGALLTAARAASGM